MFQEITELSLSQEREGIIVKMLEINTYGRNGKEAGVGRGQGVKMGSRKITFISIKPMTFIYLHHAMTI